MIDRDAEGPAKFFKEEESIGGDRHGVVGIDLLQSSQDTVIDID
jgi:hypothetical protein